MRPFEGPIHVERPAALDVEGKAVRCTCAGSPFCRGAASADWSSCSLTCKACNPRARQRRRRPAEHPRGERDA